MAPEHSHNLDAVVVPVIAHRRRVLAMLSSWSSMISSCSSLMPTRRPRGCGPRTASGQNAACSTSALARAIGPFRWPRVFEYTIAHGDGPLRGWRVVDGPTHLPFFIDYPNNGDRAGRLQATYDRVGHRCAPRGFSELTISGSAIEMREWLGPNELPVRFVAGDQGLIEASITTANGHVVIR